MEKASEEPEADCSVMNVPLIDGQSRARMPEVGKADVAEEEEEDVVVVAEADVGVVEILD